MFTQPSDRRKPNRPSLPARATRTETTAENVDAHVQQHARAAVVG